MNLKKIEKTFALIALAAALTAPATAIELVADAALTQAAGAAGDGGAAFDNDRTRGSLSGGLTVDGADGAGCSKAHKCGLRRGARPSRRMSEPKNPMIGMDQAGKKEEAGKEKKGGMMKKMLRLGGSALAGAGIGFLVGGPMGALIGGLLGGVLGWLAPKLLGKLFGKK